MPENLLTRKVRRSASRDPTPVAYRENAVQRGVRGGTGPTRAMSLLCI